jgi:hypothetical protein
MRLAYGQPFQIDVIVECGKLIGVVRKTITAIAVETPHCGY